MTLGAHEWSSIRRSRCVEQFEEKELALQEACRQAVVTIELKIVEGRGDSVPAGHGGGLHALHVGHSDGDDVAQAHRLADQDDLNLDGGTGGELFGAKEINPRGTDIAGDESDGSSFARTIDGTETQREIERGARIFAVFGKDAYGMSRYASETTGLRGNEKRLQAQRRSAVQLRKRLRNGCARANFDARFGWPLFQWSYAI